MATGNRIKLYIMAYAVYRFLTEWLRPEANIYFGLTAYQISSIVIAILFAWLWFRDQMKLKIGLARKDVVAD